MTPMTLRSSKILPKEFHDPMGCRKNLGRNGPETVLAEPGYRSIASDPPRQNFRVMSKEINDFMICRSVEKEVGDFDRGHRERGLFSRGKETEQPKQQSLGTCPYDLVEEIRSLI